MFLFYKILTNDIITYITNKIVYNISKIICILVTVDKFSQRENFSGRDFLTKTESSGLTWLFNFL